MVAITRSALKRQLQLTNVKTKTSRVIKKKVTIKKKTTVKQRKAPSSSTTTTIKTTTVKTTSAPLQAYNDVVGRSNITDALAYDRYYNPVGREYDLGRDAAFIGFNILIAQFYTDYQFDDKAMQVPIDELKMKGFQVKHVKSEDECIKELASNHYQVAWIISTNSIQNPNFIPSLTTFHSNGGAIFLFADNTPYTCHVNDFLKSKFGITVVGDYWGGKTMTYEDNGHQEKGHFGQHDIFTGIKNLFEGITICHPVYSTAKSREIFVPIGTATDGNTSIAVYDPSSSTSNDGRLCLDCGFTKLYTNWDSAGTARYIVNASCWLLKIENRFT